MDGPSDRWDPTILARRLYCGNVPYVTWMKFCTVGEGFGRWCWVPEVLCVCVLLLLHIRTIDSSFAPWAARKRWVAWRASPWCSVSCMQSAAEAYRFGELFAGEANVTRCMKLSGFPSFKMDLSYAGFRYNDMCTSSGFAQLGSTSGMYVYYIYIIFVLKILLINYTYIYMSILYIIFTFQWLYIYICVYNMHIYIICIYIYYTRITSWLFLMLAQPACLLFWFSISSFYIYFYIYLSLSLALLPCLLRSLSLSLCPSLFVSLVSCCVSTSVSAGAAILPKAGHSRSAEIASKQSLPHGSGLQLILLDVLSAEPERVVLPSWRWV